MIFLGEKLELDRCPYCRVNHPNLTKKWEATTKNYQGDNLRIWQIHQCAHCGGLVTAWAWSTDDPISGVLPPATAIPPELPEKAKAYLTQASDSLHAPAGAVILAASAVDAMLKTLGEDFKAGSLNDRINRAAKNHLLTDGMAKWAHTVRLDANEQRHAADDAPLPTEAEAQRSIDFASALGMFLFVLPARIAQGLKSAGEKK